MDLPKEEIIEEATNESQPNHSLGLQDLYKAAFSQLKKEDEPYQMYAVKTLTFQPEAEISDASGAPTLSYGIYEACDSNAVLDLDQGIPIQIIKGPEDGINNTTTLHQIHYNCDNQILQRYLQEASLLRPDSTDLSSSNSEAIIYKPLICTSGDGTENVTETLTMQTEVNSSNQSMLNIENCDFNSSDSFASTESIIPKSITCPKCPKKFMFKSDLARHDKKKHSIKQKLTCSKCNKKFPSAQNLLFHERSHKDTVLGSEGACGICSKKFSTTGEYGRHMKVKHKRLMPFNCRLCPQEFPSTMLRASHYEKEHNILDISKNTDLSCELCNKQFSSKASLQSHKRIHATPIACLVCGKKYSKKSYLKMHEQKHCLRKVEPQLTEQTSSDVSTVGCSNSFNINNAFDHEENLVSTKQKATPRMCSICKTIFTTSKSLTKHMKEHKLQCQTCFVTFSSLAKLNQHIKAGHKITQEICTQTEELFQLQNVNIVAESALDGAQPIVLTPLTNFNSGSFIVNIAPTTTSPLIPVPYSVAS